MSSPKEDTPKWRQKLQSTPVEDRFQTQNDLIRALELADALLADTKASSSAVSGLTPLQKTLWALETLYYSFRGNGVWTLFPLLIEIPVMFIQTIEHAEEWAQAHSGSESDLRASPCDATLYVACRLLDPAWWSNPNNMSIDQVRSCLKDLEALEGLVEWLSSVAAVGDAALAAQGTRLTVAKLRSMWVFVRAILAVDAKAGSGAQRVAAPAVKAFFRALERGPVDWHLASNCMRVFDGLKMARNSGPGVPDEPRVLRRCLAAAEAEGDPFRVGWCAAELGVSLGWQGAPYAELQALAEKAGAANERCKAALPAFTREGITRALDFMQKQLAGFRRGHPGTYMDHPVRFSATLFRRTTTPPTAFETVAGMKICAACGARSRTLSVCARCRNAWYCSTSCQRVHWKAGHKAECKAAAPAAAPAGQS